MTNRRSFIKKVGLGTIAASNIPGFVSAESLLKQNNSDNLKFQFERTGVTNFAGTKN